MKLKILFVVLFCLMLLMVPVTVNADDVIEQSSVPWEGCSIKTYGRIIVHEIDYVVGISGLLYVFVRSVKFTVMNDPDVVSLVLDCKGGEVQVCWGHVGVQIYSDSEDDFGFIGILYTGLLFQICHGFVDLVKVVQPS